MPARRPPEQTEPDHGNAEQQEALGTAVGEAAPASSTPFLDAAAAGPAASGPVSTGGAGGGRATRTPRIRMRTEKPAPQGGLRDREVVGVGEYVRFTSDVAGGEWSVSGGSGFDGDDGAYEWEAPEVGGAVTVSYTVDGTTVTRTVYVMPPMAISGTKAGTDTFAAGQQGAGMTLDLNFHPMTVSFANVEWLEEPGPGYGTGYFADVPAEHLFHEARGEDGWLEMGARNNAANDHAHLKDWTKEPYAPGAWIWLIPNKYRLVGGEQEHYFALTTQVMTMDDDQGTSTVHKFGQSETRRKDEAPPRRRGR